MEDLPFPEQNQRASVLGVGTKGGGGWEGRRDRSYDRDVKYINFLKKEMASSAL